MKLLFRATVDQIPTGDDRRVRSGDFSTDVSATTSPNLRLGHDRMHRRVRRRPVAGRRHPFHGDVGR